jgi:hypothetical protein
MRLLLIDKPQCHNIKDLMPGIKAVYQLEAEFHPYLIVDFIPNKDDTYKRTPGIIFQAGPEVIRKDYTFDNPNDIIELRKIIWKYLKKYHNPQNITCDNTLVFPTSRVIQGWQNKKKSIGLKQSEMCNVDCKKEFIERLNKKPDIVAYNLLHDMYKFNKEQRFDFETNAECKYGRSTECSDNFPKGSDNYKKCMQEINIVCDNDFPKNSFIKNTDALITPIYNSSSINTYTKPNLQKKVTDTKLNLLFNPFFYFLLIIILYIVFFSK